MFSEETKVSQRKIWSFTVLASFVFVVVYSTLKSATHTPPEQFWGVVKFVALFYFGKEVFTAVYQKFGKKKEG